MFDFVKSMYPLCWDKSSVGMAVESNWISKDEYREITGEEYTE